MAQRPRGVLGSPDSPLASRAQFKHSLSFRLCQMIPSPKRFHSAPDAKAPGLLGAVD